jgi:hypothetical protein
MQDLKSLVKVAVVHNMCEALSYQLTISKLVSRAFSALTVYFQWNSKTTAMWMLLVLVVTLSGHTVSVFILSLPTAPHGVTTQNTNTDVFTAVRNSSITQNDIRSSTRLTVCSKTKYQVSGYVSCVDKIPADFFNIK